MRRLASILCAGALLLLAVAACGDDEAQTAPSTSASSSSAPGADDGAGDDEARAIVEVTKFGDEFAALERGPYFIDPDDDASTPLRVTFQVAADGWSSWFGAVKFAHDSHVTLSITTVDNLVRDACVDHTLAQPAVGPTVDDLATALSRLAPFEVTSAPSDVTMLGYRGKHLALRVPDLAVTNGHEPRFTDCTEGELRSWSAPHNGGPFSGYNAEPGRTEEFWILDVNGTRLVLETTTGPSSSPQDVAERQAIFDSIQIQP